MASAKQRLRDLRRFYKILAKLERRLGGRRRLGACHGRMGWPRRGVYFFFEHGEERIESGEGSRVVRVGTHALKRGAKSKLWGRLRQHRGKSNSWLGGDSVFRTHIGRALMSRDGNPPDERWTEEPLPGQELTPDTIKMQRRITGVIGEMHFLWLAVPDNPGPNSKRGYIERNAIALLSNYGRETTVDAASQFWLGKCQYAAYQNGANAISDDMKISAERIHDSGLWSVEHVDEEHEREFLRRLDKLVEKMKV